MHKYFELQNKKIVKTKLIQDYAKQDSMILFFNAIQSDYTKKTYFNNLDRFRNHFLIRDFDSLLKFEPEKINKMILDYVLYLKNEKNLTKTTLNNYLCTLDLFYSMNDIVINKKKIVKLFPESRKISGDLPYTLELSQQALRNLQRKSKFKALFLMMVSSGSRAGFVEYLKFRDIGEYEKFGCQSIRVYSGTKDEYLSFLNPEAVESLNEFVSEEQKVRVINPDSFVFTRKGKSEHMLGIDVSKAFRRYFKNMDFGDKLNGHNRIAIAHGLRKRWNTIAKSSNANSSVIEKLYGHSSTIQLDNRYFKPTWETLVDEYVKFMPELIVDEAKRKDIEIKKLREEKLAKDEAKDKEIVELKTQLQMITQHLLNSGIIAK